MDGDRAWQLIGLIVASGITITLTLVGIIFSWLRNRIDRNEESHEKQISELRTQYEERFRSVYHELRDKQSQLDGLLKMMIEDISAQTRESNDYQNVYDQLKKRQEQTDLLIRKIVAELKRRK